MSICSVISACVSPGRSYEVPKGRRWLPILYLGTSTLGSACPSPGMSTSVRFGTLGEYTVSWIGSGATALPFPLRYRFVSASISSRIASAIAMTALIFQCCSADHDGIMRCTGVSGRSTFAHVSSFASPYQSLSSSGDCYGGTLHTPVHWGPQA